MAPVVESGRRRSLRTAAKMHQSQINYSDSKMIDLESLEEMSILSKKKSTPASKAPDTTDSKRRTKIRVKFGSRSPPEALNANRSVTITPNTLQTPFRKTRKSMPGKRRLRTSPSAPQEPRKRRSVEEKQAPEEPQPSQEQNNVLLQSAQAVTDAMRNHQTLLAKESSLMETQQRELDAQLVRMRHKALPPATTSTHISTLQKNLSEKLDELVTLEESEKKFHKLKAKLGHISAVGLAASEEDLKARRTELSKSIDGTRAALSEAERMIDIQLRIAGEQAKLDDLTARYEKHCEGLEWWEVMTRLTSGGPGCEWNVSDMVKISQTFITWMEPRMSEELSESS
ncbi:hypothetical protein ACHAPT_010277 [Fusarium lateritium]